jgi:hypothetical protein
VDLTELRTLLAQKREFILTLLENPNLLEHDAFTDLPDKDLEHLAGDIRRLYDHLSSEWLNYVEHLKGHYPFLFSLVLRTHPFQERPSAIID